MNNFMIFLGIIGLAVYLFIGWKMFSITTLQRIFTGQISADGRDILTHWPIVFLWPFKKILKLY